MRTWSGRSSSTPLGTRTSRPFCQLAALWAVNLSSPATSVPEQLVGFVERRELDAVRGRVDLDPALADRGEAGDVDLEQVLGGDGRRSRGRSLGTANESGSKPRRSVNRHASCVVSGSGSAW